MRRLLIIFSLSMLFGAFLLTLMSRDNGYVLIAWGRTTVEMSLWMGVLITVGVLWFMLFVFRLSYVLRMAWAHFQLARQQKLTTRGWIDFAEGEWKRAASAFLQAAPRAGAPFSNYLMAARAANEMGEQEKAEEILGQAEEQAPKAHVAINLTRAEIQLQNRQWNECLATLLLIRRHSPRHRAALTMLRTVYMQLRQWESLQLLASDMYRAKLIDETQRAHFEREAIEHMLIDAADDAGKDAHPLQKLDAAWQKLPKVSRQSRAMVLQYARGLSAFGAEARAEELLRTTVHDGANSEWLHPDIILLYGRIRGQDAARQLAVAEVWSRSLPNDATMLLTLGRLSLRNRQWEKAKHYFENCLRRGENAEANLELGRLLIAMHDLERGKKLLDKGLSSSHTLPALPLP